VPVAVLPPFTVQAMFGVRPGWLLTMPPPVPPPVTLSRNDGTDEPLKTALTLRFTFILTVQVGAVPVQAPLHSLNVLPGWAVAVSVTLVYRA
jgi:hypothetical protein